MGRSVAVAFNPNSHAEKIELCAIQRKANLLIIIYLKFGDNQPTVYQFSSRRFGLFGTANGMVRQWAFCTDASLVFIFFAFRRFNAKRLFVSPRKVNHP
jgi:hypothetical protein